MTNTLYRYTKEVKWMPLYRYKCGDCSKEFEELRKICEADDVIECPKCKSRNTKRMMPSSVSASSGSSTPSHPAGCAE